MSLRKAVDRGLDCCIRLDRFAEILERDAKYYRKETKEIRAELRSLKEKD